MISGLFSEFYNLSEVSFRLRRTGEHLIFLQYVIPAVFFAFLLSVPKVFYQRVFNVL
jgi:hypothetical protein